MFERYLTDALTKHFGHLMENVDAEKVRLSTWNGKLVLEDLRLRTDALDHFVEKCPVELAYGRVGKLDVQVPWSVVGAQLWKRKTTKTSSKKSEGGVSSSENSEKNSSVSLILSDVNILITPRRNYDASKQFDSNREIEDESSTGNGDVDDDDAENSDAITQKRRERKEKAVQDLIDAQLLTRVAISASQTSSRWKWLQDSLSGLLSDLKVTVRNIHIRYEDPGSCMGFVWNLSSSSRPRRYRKAFSIGIQLGEFSVKTKADEEATTSTNNTTKDKASGDDSATDTSSLLDEESQDSKQEQPADKDNELSKAYRIRQKIAAAEQLAVYWDSGGHALVSQMAPLDESGGKRILQRSYVEAAFSLLNDGQTDTFFPDEGHFRKPHSYLLDPVSPSVRFALVNEMTIEQMAPSDPKNNNKIQIHPTTDAPIPSIPPSSIKVNLPSTLFSISRRTLEDTVYLRKSLSVWVHAKKGLLSEKTLKRLAQLRPVVSATEDPKGWWKYASEATIAFLKVSHQGQEPRNKQGKGGALRPIKRRSGWLGVAQALGKRKRYVELYKQLFLEQDDVHVIAEGPILPLGERRKRINGLLLELEDDLTAAEICAFRIASYHAVAGDLSTETAESGVPQGEDTDKSIPRRQWQGFWGRAAEEKLPPPSSSATLVTDRLSLEHRFQTFSEIVQALAREKANTKIQEEEQRDEDLYIHPDSSVSHQQMQGSATWDLSMSCQELSLQVNDQKLRNVARSTSRRSSSVTSTVPVVRLSCACLMESVLWFDGSWEAECSIAELIMKDLTRGRETSDESSVHHFRNLIGPKQSDGEIIEDTLNLDGASFRKSVTVKVSRSYDSWRNENGLDNSSTTKTQTKTQVRLYPMEVVYSTIPVESLSRVIATVKTPELSDDYHRMAGRVYEFRNKQKRRFLKALAHKEKEIYVNVDVAAPVLLIPETLSREDSPMLVVDLGRLSFSNVSSDGRIESPNEGSQFDDAWLLVLKDIQVQSSTTMLYRCQESNGNAYDNKDESSPGLQSPRQVVEPFSIDFSIFTTVAQDGDQTRSKVKASLPRLGFNFTSSAVRLMARLKSKWARRKDEVKTTAFTSTADMPTFRDETFLEGGNGDNKHSSRPIIEQGQKTMVDRTFEFQFSAPLVLLRIENDVDGRVSPIAQQNTSKGSHLPTQLVDLTIRGIGGNLVQKSNKSGSSSTVVEARLHSLLAVDLYQTAGIDYALLLSSFEPRGNFDDAGPLTEPLNEGGTAMSDLPTDLVLVKFSSQTGSEETKEGRPLGDKLSIIFHELFVEWNPESLAAIQKAMRTPTTDSTFLDDDGLSSSFTQYVQDEVHSDEEFFDAEEEEADDFFFDTVSDAGEEGTDLAASLNGLSFDATRPILLREENPGWNTGGFLRKASLYGLSQPILASNFIGESNDEATTDDEPWRPFEVEFNLSKLRVNFNKESRHRRLISAEMDQTSVKYETTSLGGSRTFAQLGNLVVLDSASMRSQTLYGPILGLQSEAAGSSLLEMEILINPKRRRSIRRDDVAEMDSETNLESVAICYEDGSVYGSDTFVRARFSPMRFVYLQQLWSEVVDYFFDGVMGYEVWGKEPPSAATQALKGGPNDSQDSLVLANTVDPFQVSFTRFDVTIDSPVVLFPVTYRSTQYVRLNASAITLSNFFRYSGGTGPDDSVRWHNNCNVSFVALRIFNWDGQEISHAKKSVGSKVTVRWPIGPRASIEKPKWDVACELESLDLALRREDYALFQNIVSYNIGELSRNLDEWDALQNLSDEDLACYKDSIMVHFGYDKKDVAPTTYKVALYCPVLSISLVAERGSVLAIARCSELAWEMQKLDDRISRQKVSCAIDLTCPKNDGSVEALLSNIQGESNHTGVYPGIPELRYTSTSKPSGDNIKTLDIANGCIYMVYPAWKSISGFFTGLPEAEILTVEEVALSVQIGDRWYRIGNSQRHIQRKVKDAADKSTRRFSWIENTPHDTSKHDEVSAVSDDSFQLRVTLQAPCIVLSSSNTNIDSSVVLRLQHLDFLHTNNGPLAEITRSFFVHDLELYTSSLQNNDHRDQYSGENSLIRPWCVAGTTTRCNGKHQCNCDSHSLRVSADILEARAAFSDMMVSIDVILRLLSDVRQSQNKAENLASTSGRSGMPAEVEQDLGEPGAQDSTSLVDSPKSQLMAMEWDGFELQVVDDSGRHFAGSQELITLALGKILFSSKKDSITGVLVSEQARDEAKGLLPYEMTLRLMSVDLYDCLQLEMSPFRLLATSRSEGFDEQQAMHVARERMKWKDFSMIASGELGFSPPCALVERVPRLDFSVGKVKLTKQEELNSILLHSVGDELSKYYAVKLNSLSLQWSPSTVIAMQRFGGRLKKQAFKSLQAFNEDVSTFMTSNEAIDRNEKNTSKRTEKVKAVLDIQALIVALNKEHQYRRLVQVSLSGAHVTLDRHERSTVISGNVADISAWDCDDHGMATNSPEKVTPNTCLLKVTGLNNEANSIGGKRSFLEFRYNTFDRKARPSNEYCAPEWVLSHLMSGTDGGIDDYLELSVATVELTYLREQSEEILDYLSNGLPGKGMGKFKKSGEEFLKARIRTKSFLQVQIEAPTLLIPSDDNSSSGVSLRLGDMALNSWFEGGTAEGRIDEIELSKDVASIVTSARAPLEHVQTDWWRMLSLRISNFSVGVFEREGHDANKMRISALNKPLDLSLVCQKSAWQNRALSLRCKMTVLEMIVKYSQYCLVNAVMKGNLGKKIDPSKWDNIEKAYDLEQDDKQQGDVQQIDTTAPPSKHVEYASGARRIRYGTKSLRTSATKTRTGTDEAKDDDKAATTNIRLNFDGLTLKLHRDDVVEGIDETDTESGLGYDMILLRVQIVEVSLFSNASKDVSLHLSLHRIGLFDLGDHGRLIREKLLYFTPKGKKKGRNQKKHRLPCAFSVLVEGYSPTEKSELSQVDETVNGSNSENAQLVVTIDRVPASSVGAIGSLVNPIKHDGNEKVTIAKVEVNFLSVNALIRPFKELLAFFAMSWPGRHAKGSVVNSNHDQANSIGDKAEKAPKLAKQIVSSVSCLHVRLVAHYPRIFFVADESDPHSRALVLRGLAVVNAGRTTKTEIKESTFFSNYYEDVQEEVAVEAHLHCLESYINPDVHDALRLQKRHADLLDSVPDHPFFYGTSDSEEDQELFLGDDALGVALLQPVTAGLEFGRNSRSRFPSKRSVSVNIEPISTMISFEDLRLIESVLQRWSSERGERDGESGFPQLEGMQNRSIAGAISTTTYDVTFESKQLGLGLRKDGDHVVVEEVCDPTYSGIIEVGDRLVLIGGHKLCSSSLTKVVQQLAKESRPTKLTFSRSTSSVTYGTEGPDNQSTKPSGEPTASHLNSSIHSYTCMLKRGAPHGLSLERSTIADIPVVVDLDSALSRNITANSDSGSGPKSGALIIEVNGKQTAEMGYLETMKLLQDFTNASAAGQVTSYAVTFFEAESTSWGHHDNLDVTVSGAVLTFIDDLNGRDMPLVKGNLQAVELRIERGLGIKTSLLDSGVKWLPSIIQNGSAESEAGLDGTMAISAVAKTTIDYFHPRISKYEPFLEPAQLCIIFERQNGREQNPGEVALEVSDRLLRQPSPDSPVNQGERPQLVCVNLTNTCVEVFAKTLREWAAWRETVKKSSDDSESLIYRESYLNRPTPMESRLLGDEHGDESAFVGADERRTVKHVAARNAAQAALLFAQKRGANTTGAKSESAKPFVFRNRTGVSIAFVQQKLDQASSHGVGRTKRGSQLSLVGEYKGLERYSPYEVIELADGQDAKFHMDVLSKKTASPNDADKRVRSYEGQFPLLTVSIQAVAGVSVEPVRDLQVYKAGNLIRHLSVHRSEENEDSRKHGESHSRYSVPIVWNVEIEDNRRILTLSSAVQIISLGSISGIEVGVQSHMLSVSESRSTLRSRPEPCLASGSTEVALVADPSEQVIESHFHDKAPSTIQVVGVAQPENPFYLPLWLALKLELVRVFVRPKVSGQPGYFWGHTSVLEFGPSGESPSSASTDWVWQNTFDDSLGSIRCSATDHQTPAVFLSCFASGLKSKAEDGAVSQMLKPSLKFDIGQSLDEVLSVSIDAGLTLRNMLPAAIDWEGAHVTPSGPKSVDGTTLRRQTSGQSSSNNEGLKCGDLVDVYACCYKKESISFRFRLLNQQAWSTWATISSPKEQGESEDGSDYEVDKDETAPLPAVSQINVQVEDDFGVPITFGIRIVPKIAKASAVSSSSLCFGVDVIVFAELWIGNLTKLPLIFGCVGSQFHDESEWEKRKKPADAHIATKFSAEAALMEIASVLELGEKGTGMDTRSADLAASAGEIYNIPHQESSYVVEEIFEFVETKDSAVKRRWWGTESYWNLRDSRVLDLSDNGKGWRWNDEVWKIDCAGQTSEVARGWESCKDLLGSGEGPFSTQRSFNPNHAFRRRRWFRSRTTNGSDHTEHEGAPHDPLSLDGKSATLLPGLQAFHHPVVDSFSMAKKKAKRKRRKKKKQKKYDEDHIFDVDGNDIEIGKKNDDHDTFKIAIKCGDGRWSAPAQVSSRGTCRGAVKVFASRWLSLTKGTMTTPVSLRSAHHPEEKHISARDDIPHSYESAPLKPALYELVYNVSEVEGEWGELSRLMLVSARFSVRNDSKSVTLAIKQAGTRDEYATTIAPGEVVPFYWSDFRLPQLACIRPVVMNGNSENVFKWSGGFDVCRLGMTSLMVRRATHDAISDDEGRAYRLRTIRSLVEIRPGTGGSGVNLSFREESPDGDGALFRIENDSHFHVWMAQDGVLANPSATSPQDSMADGDLIRPGDKLSFGLDVPYRQGKYAHRKAATLAELLRVRIGLAPLSSHAGIETTKVIGLSLVGESTRLKPAKLITVLDAAQRKAVESVRVLAVTTADGPSRVLKFRLMANTEADSALSSAFKDSVAYGAFSESLISGSYAQEALRSATLARCMLDSTQLPTEDEAKREALFGKAIVSTRPDRKSQDQDTRSKVDRLFSVRFVFSGFFFSLVDSSPSEICTVAVNNVNVLAKWNLLRTSDASFLMSVGWLQIDNHCPSAPFPVALCPDEKDTVAHDDDKNNETETPIVWPMVAMAREDDTPLLVLGVEFAPDHSSGIVCLKSVTVAPRSMAISLDLALLVRLQRYLTGIQMHFQQRRAPVGDDARSSHQSDNKRRAISLPGIDKRIRELHDAAVKAGVGRMQFYFGAIAILPWSVKLSVAPARALTTAQAIFEGPEAAAIHQAVRKGDLRLGGASVPLDVRIGGKNTTAKAVARGVFKSIVVDALLRMDGASVKFEGAFLRNQIFYGPQLATYLGAHYMQSLRQNVPSLLGSLAFFGNPLGLVRGLGEGVTDFVTEPVKGMKKSIQRLDPSHMMDGMARGTGSLARHTVGGFAASSALLTSTFSKNMAVLTLDRRYAQKRDRGNMIREQEGGDFYILDGFESGFVKLAQGFVEGVAGVVRAPMRGAERSGLEGFAKGIGKGLLGLVVKPMIGVSDAATDVMIGVRSSVGGGEGQRGSRFHHVRPRRALYGQDKDLRVYNLGDAAACTLLLRTRIGGESYASHVDMDDRVALLSYKTFLLLNAQGKELLLIKFKNISTVEIQEVESGTWGVLIALNTPRRNGSLLEIITCKTRDQALELCNQLKHGISLLESEV